MLTFEYIKLWYDVGYSAADRTVPPIFSNKLPDPDFVFGDAQHPIKMQKTGVVYKVDLPISYAQAIDLTYIEVKIVNGRIFFGWIRQVSQISGQADVCTIDWEADYWRTYARDIIINSGTITAIDEETANEIQSFSGYDVLKSNHYMADLVDLSPNIGKSGYWYLISYLKSQTSEQKFAFCRIQDDTDNNNNIYIRFNNNNYRSINLSEIDIIVSSSLHISPESILGAWFVPFCPIQNYMNIMVEGNNYIINLSPPAGYIENIENYNEAGIFMIDDHMFVRRDINGNLPNEFTILIPDNFRTDDKKTQCLVDSIGNIIGTMPYRQIDNQAYFKIGIACSATSCYIYISIYKQSQDIAQINNNGLYFQFPAFEVPIFSNQWNSYVYSGQKDYDRYAIREQNAKSTDKQMQNAVETAATGQLVGGVLGGGIGAAAGAVVGGLAGFIGDFSNNLISADSAKKIQEEKEKMIQKTASNQLIAGNNVPIFYNARYANIHSIYSRTVFGIVLTPDSTSLAEYESRIANFGKKLNYNFGNSNNVKNYLSLIDPSSPSARPIQIVNLSASGAPLAAIEKIKEKLQAGVYIIEKN